MIIANVLQILLWAPYGVALFFAILFLGQVLVPFLVLEDRHNESGIHFIVGFASLGVITLGLTYVAVYSSLVAALMTYIGAALMSLGLYHIYRIGLSKGFDCGLWLYISSFLLVMIFQFGPVPQFGVDTPANNFKLDLPIDYKIPLMFAESVINGKLLTFGDWLGSDRPPLMSGFVLLLTPPMVALEDGYLFVGTLVQLLVVPVAFIMLRAIVPGDIAQVSIGSMVILLMAISPLFIHNISFLWPKILASAFFLGALLILLVNDPIDLRLSVLCGVFFGLAYMSHGGVAFAILSLGLIYLVLRFTPRGLLQGTIIFLVFLMCYLPWSYYKAYIQPPGDRLLKWHLLDHIPVTDKSFFEIAVEKYEGFGLSDFTARLGSSIDHQFILPLRKLSVSEGHIAIGDWLVEASFFSTFASVGFLTLPVLVVVSLSVRDRTVCLGIFLWISIFLVWATLSFKGAKFVHEGAYPAQILPWLIIAYGLQLIDRSWLRRVLVLVLGLQAVLTLMLFWEVRADRSLVPGSIASIQGDINGTDFANTTLPGWRVIGTWGPNGNKDMADIRIELMGAERIMYITGPAAGGQRLLVESDKRVLFEEVEKLQPSWLTINLDPTEHVSITLADSGAAWGQWSAVAVPSGR